MASGSKIKNNLVIQGSVTASAFSGDGSALTGINTDTSNLATTSSNSFTGDQTVTGSVVATGDSSRTRFLAATLSDLPSATNNHGMFAHVHATGLGYYAHAGNWIPLATSESVAGIDVTIPSTYLTTTAFDTETISKDILYDTSVNIINIPTSSYGSSRLEYQLNNPSTGSRNGVFITAHNGSEVSYNDLTFIGAGSGNAPNITALITGSNVEINIENARGYNFRAFTKKFDQTSPVILPDPNAPTPLLDTYTGAAVAYSLRKLRTAYTGSAVRIRRASDHAETDIGFDVSNNLDTSAISTFCGNSNGFVEIWYDQSGNVNNVIQETQANQPQIYDGSAVITENGKAALDFDGDFMTAGSITNTSDQTFSFVTKVDSTLGVLASNGQRALFNNGGNATYQTTQGSENDKVYGTWTTTQKLHFVYHNNTTTANSFGRINAVEQALDPSANGKWTSLVLGRYDATSGLNYNGNIQEFIFWTSGLADGKTSIETNINNHYSIYDTGLLEDYPGAAAAYSVRQLTTSATSSMNIRRDSDNTEQVIGFTPNGDLDTGSIETFCSGTECYVDTWYDQSGNGNDAVQGSKPNQPLIYSASAVITENGKSAIDFQYDVLATTGSITLSDGAYFSVAVGTTNGGQNNVLVASDSNPRFGQFVRADANNAIRSIGFNSSNRAIGSIGSIVGTDTQFLAIGECTGTNLIVYANGTAGTSVSLTNRTGTAPFYVGARNASRNDSHNGYVQEVLHYPDDQSSNRSGIETNINSYFNIY